MARQGAAQTADAKAGVALGGAHTFGAPAVGGRMLSDGPANAGVSARRALGGNGPMHWRVFSRTHLYSSLSACAARTRAVTEPECAIAPSSAAWSAALKGKRRTSMSCS